MPKLGEDIYKKDRIYLVPKPESEEIIKSDLWEKSIKRIEKDWFYDPHYYGHGQREIVKLNE